MPEEAKGGVLAPADVALLKRAIVHYIAYSASGATEEEVRQGANLLHRLGRISPSKRK